MSPIGIGAIAVLAALASIGAYLDFRYRRLPNWLCLTTLGIGIGLGLAIHGPAWAGMGLLHAFVALLIGMALFAMRMIGGGDAKFYAAVAAWLPINFGIHLAVAISLAGVLVVLAWLPFRRRIAQAVKERSLPVEFRKIPYGPAISIGAVSVYGVAVVI